MAPCRVGVANARPSSLLPGPLNRTSGCDVLRPLNLNCAPKPKSCRRSTKSGVRAALAASPSINDPKGGELEGLVKEARLRKGRAALRAWWYAQLLQKAENDAQIAEANYAQAAEFARQMDLEEGRAVMRYWWLDQQLQSLDPSRPPSSTVLRTRRNPTSWRTPKQAATSVWQAAPSGRQATASGQQSAASETSTAPSEPKTMIAKEGARAQAKGELVGSEVRKGEEIAWRKALQSRAETQQRMDKGRAAMRKWWVQEREATKRALGLAPYGPVWTVIRKDGKEEPISIGKTPLLVGSDVSRVEGVIPVQLDYPTVSRIHAKIFGKEVFTYGMHKREYFVTDLKSTNGVRLNKKFRLRPGNEYKLSDGDTLFLGEEAATLVIKNP